MVGKRDEAKKILAKLKRKREPSFVSPAALGIVSGALGEKDEAFAWLEKAMGSGLEIRALRPLAEAPDRKPR